MELGLDNQPPCHTSLVGQIRTKHQLERLKNLKRFLWLILYLGKIKYTRITAKYVSEAKLNVIKNTKKKRKKYCFLSNDMDTNNKQLHRFVEVGCPRHPGASAIGNQLQHREYTNGWQNLTTEAWAPTPLRRRAPITLIHSGTRKVGKVGNKIMLLLPANLILNSFPIQAVQCICAS